MPALDKMLRATGFSAQALVSWLNGCILTCERRGHNRQYHEIHEVLCRCLAALGHTPNPHHRPLDVMGRARSASMLMNRCFLTVEGAVRASENGQAEVYRDALLIGALREDVAVIPRTSLVYEHASLDHAYREGENAGFVRFFSVGAVHRCRELYTQVVALHRQNGANAGYTHLGRVLHILGDLYVPVHAHAVPHSTDPYEWMIEARFRELLGLQPDSTMEVDDVEDCVRQIAHHTRRFEPDRSNHPLKRWSRRLRATPRVPTNQLWQQARVLVPFALARAGSCGCISSSATSSVEAPGKLIGSNIVTQFRKGTYELD